MPAKIGEIGYWGLRMWGFKRWLGSKLDAFCSIERALTLAEAGVLPCTETSDSKALCRAPVVSVLVVAYNHEPYIREAIESVVSQQTDFEFEVIVGEDCSQDRTREICFELQREHPDKVRVLWANENVYAGGGNYLRNLIRARGEYVALLDGDDYWIDAKKLQKQVDLLRKTNASACFAWSEYRYPDGRVRLSTYDAMHEWLNYADLFTHYFHTSTYMCRRDVYLSVISDYPEIRAWFDTTFCNVLVAKGICQLPEIVSAYRISRKGMYSSLDKKKELRMLTYQYLQLFLYGPQDACQVWCCRQCLSFLIQLRNLGGDVLGLKLVFVALVVWNLRYECRRLFDSAWKFLRGKEINLPVFLGRG